MYLSNLAITSKEGVFDDHFSYFSSKPYVVTPYLNRLVETVQVKGHNVCFYDKLTTRAQHAGANAWM